MNTLHIVTVGHNKAWYLVDAPGIAAAMGLAEARFGTLLPEGSRSISTTHPEADRILNNLVDKTFFGKLTFKAPPYCISENNALLIEDSKGNWLVNCADTDTATLVLNALLAYKS